MEIMSPKKTKTTSYVPNDIIIDILSWVPANSLLRLRWACKYWFHLITRDTCFAKLHLHTATSSSSSTTTTNQDYFSVLISKQLNRPWLEPQPQGKIFQYYSVYNSTITSDGYFSSLATNPILPGIFVDFLILGSCHGLILFSYCLRERKETILCIWNPCTKEYKYLPTPPYWFDVYNRLVGVNKRTNFGLGYDHSIQDYKVICNAKSRRNIYVQVYTLRTNSSWRYIRSITTNYNTGFIGNGVFVNGALHFIYYEGAALYPGTRRILSFDFGKEMYVEISNQPECLNDMAKFTQGLALFEGSLCLTMSTGSGPRTSIEAWVMKKDYNMNNNNQEEYSWSKLYGIPHFYSQVYDKLQPQRFTKDGEIMLLVHSKPGREAHDLYFFDPNNNKLTIHKIYKFHPIEQAATTIIEVVYIESLVSLNSGTYIDEKGDMMLMNGDVQKMIEAVQ